MAMTNLKGIRYSEASNSRSQSKARACGYMSRLRGTASLVGRASHENQNHKN